MKHCVKPTVCHTRQAQQREETGWRLEHSVREYSDRPHIRESEKDWGGKGLQMEQYAGKICKEKSVRNLGDCLGKGDLEKRMRDK